MGPQSIPPGRRRAAALRPWVTRRNGPKVATANDENRRCGASVVVGVGWPWRSILSPESAIKSVLDLEQTTPIPQESMFRHMAKDGWQFAPPADAARLGQLVTPQLLPPNGRSFIASWDKEQQAREGDIYSMKKIAGTAEIWQVDRHAFNETYEILYVPDAAEAEDAAGVYPQHP
eukprot:Skav213017  [mRNA]  locus=scaffold2312:190749:191715:+ [translate_table: standard]